MTDCSGRLQMQWIWEVLPVNNIAMTLDQASKSVCQKWIPALFFVSQKG